MASNTYTEEEFKKVLKNLFAEKKRVKDLEKRLEEKGLQKRFQAKLTDIHKLSLSEEYAKLKAALLEKEQECSELKGQVDKVRPALKKLMTDLKNAAFEIETLKSERHSHENEELKKAVASIASLQEHNQALEQALAKKEEEGAKLSEAHERIVLLQAENQHAFDDQIRLLKGELDAAQGALEEVRAHGQKEAERFEAERGHLVERLAETLGQMQRQSEMLTEQREEIALLRKQAEEEELQKVEMVELRAALEAAEKQLQESDFVALRREYEAKMQEALVSFSHKEVAHEESLEHCYVKMREMAKRHAEIVEEREILYKKVEDHNKFLAKFEKEQGVLQTSLKSVKLQCEEGEAELRQAQQHLAKKVKETTLLQDLAESQKLQLLELHALIEKQKSELERLQNSIHLQRVQDEKMLEVEKERARALENQIKEWENKYLALQKDWEEKKGQLHELQQLRKTYEQMASTFSNLKTILGHNLDPSQPENTQDPGN
ncbi:hypothetical protein ACFLR2_01610 [Chlamydiota bacterium]